MSSPAESVQIEDEDVSTTLYFGNLHAFVQQSSLEDLCAYFGPVDTAKVIKDKGTGSSAGYGFVKFADRAVAESALQSLNGKAYLGQELRVNWALPNNHKEDTSHHFHVFVGDLGSDVTDAVLYNTFCTVGQCSDARVMWDHGTGRSKGYGFVSFRRKEDADAAIEQMQGRQIGSRRIRVGWAQHKQEDNVSPLDSDSIDRADPSNTNVYIGNIAPETNEADLVAHFEAFGPVAEIKLHKKGGYGFVKYELHDSAVKAIAQGHNKEALHGRVLKCAWGKSAASSSHASAPAPAFNPANSMQGLQLPSNGHGLFSGSGASLDMQLASLAAAANAVAATAPASMAPAALRPYGAMGLSSTDSNSLLFNNPSPLLFGNSQQNASLSMALATQMLMFQQAQNMQAYQQAQQDSLGQALAAFNAGPAGITAGNMSLNSHSVFGGMGAGGGLYGGGGFGNNGGGNGGLYSGYGSMHQF